MVHWKKLMDPKDMLYAMDLDGRDVTVTFERVTGGEVTGELGKKSKKPIAHIKGKTKKLALNATNCKTITALTGTPDTEKWAGIRITLFPTTTEFGGETKECIRIRPYWPKESSKESKSKGGTAKEPGQDLTQAIADEMAAQATVPRADDDDADADITVPADGAST